MTYTKNWITKFRNDDRSCHLRFKILESGFGGYPRFEIDEELIDKIGLEDFIKNENNRIPFFVGTQMGIYPQINSIPGFYNGDKIIAILGKSVLSGHVAGLRIVMIPIGAIFNQPSENNPSYHTMASYSNDEL